MIVKNGNVFTEDIDCCNHCFKKIPGCELQYFFEHEHDKSDIHMLVLQCKHSLQDDILRRIMAYLLTLYSKDEIINVTRGIT